MKEINEWSRRAVGLLTGLGAVSFFCLILYYLALTDIWQESGRPDFWAGEGLCSFEWRLMGYCYWPMLIFHLCFFVTTVVFAMKTLRR